MFDVFEFAQSLAVLQMPREMVFSPLKNATGSDSPATCRRSVSVLMTIASLTTVVFPSGGNTCRAFLRRPNLLYL